MDVASWFLGNMLDSTHIYIYIWHWGILFLYDWGSACGWLAQIKIPLLILYGQQSNCVCLCLVLQWFLAPLWRKQEYYIRKKESVFFNFVFLVFGSFLMCCYTRSLTPQGLADTLCGSPLYMAPEIIQNQKYDAKVMKFRTKIGLYLQIFVIPFFFCEKI